MACQRRRQRDLPLARELLAGASGERVDGRRAEERAAHPALAFAPDLLPRQPVQRLARRAHELQRLRVALDGNGDTSGRAGSAVVDHPSYSHARSRLHVARAAQVHAARRRDVHGSGQAGRALTRRGAGSAHEAGRQLAQDGASGRTVVVAGHARQPDHGDRERGGSTTQGHSLLGLLHV
eukprot:5236285-Prymnesium_polylepis.1